MGLFVRTDQANEQPLYKIISGNDIAGVPSDQRHKTLLIVGLGNIGKEYVGTRHNIGFDVIEHFCKKNDFSDWATKKDLHCQQTSGVIKGLKIIVCKPTTLMNESGRAVQAMQRFYKINNARTLVIHDELDVDFGQIRTRIGGGPAGHNGIKSLIQHIGEDFGRIRIGIGPKSPAAMDSAGFVLAKFGAKQTKDLPLLLQETNAILSEYCYSDGNLPHETRSFII